ncbi:MAG: hypothetical protein H0U81_14125 [Pyrinomonadaceae bacterium]|nr:hypothetical protein [Pyrinomonadaceae bacterium]
MDEHLLMINGELLTKVTIWVTIVGYAAGTAFFALARKRREWDAVARMAWTVACVGLLAHFMSAFHFYHGWSQIAAYRDTARQTAEVFGLDWGGGLYVNYALLLAWVLDVLLWWRHGLDAYRRRPWPLVAAWHGLLIFIFFNATVVFKTGIMRWAGLCMCLGLCLVWWRATSNNSPRSSGNYPLTVAED